MISGMVEVRLSVILTSLVVTVIVLSALVIDLYGQVEELKNK